MDATETLLAEADLRGASLEGALIDRASLDAARVCGIRLAGVDAESRMAVAAISLLLMGKPMGPEAGRIKT